MQKFDHPLFSVVCLLHPIKIIKKTEALAGLTDYPFSRLAAGLAPTEGFLSTLQEEFENFISRYCTEEERSELRDRQSFPSLLQRRTYRQFPSLCISL